MAQFMQTHTHTNDQSMKENRLYNEPNQKPVHILEMEEFWGIAMLEFILMNCLVNVPA